MSFLHLQLALAGLACVGIPIIIHLLMRRRRKPVMWGAMRFLLEAYRKQRRKLMVEKWLLLATRCLLVALLALAIGRPLIGALIGGGAGRTVYVVIDNGLASGAVGADGVSALERHKATARSVLDTLQGSDAEGDRAALVALGAPADPVVLPVSADVPAVATLLGALSPVDARTDLPGAIALVASAIEADRAGIAGNSAGARRSSGRTFVVILSDFLEGSADLTASLAKLPEGTKVLASTPAASGLGNVSIMGVEPQRSVVVTGKAAPGEAGAPAGASADQVRVTLQRSGPSTAQAGTTTVILNMAGVRDRSEAASLAESGRATVRWEPGQETATAAIQALRRPSSVDRAAGAGALTEVLEARIQGGNAAENAVPGDDTWRRPVEVRDALRVGIVSPRRFGERERVDRLDASEWLRLALSPGDEAGLEVAELEPSLLDGARLAGLDAVCLPRPDLLTAEHWQRLRLFLESGGLLFVMPPSEVQVHLWPDAMVKELGLPWRVAREPKSYGADGALPATIAPLAGSQGRRDLLSQIEAEISLLARPVGVWRALPVELERTEARVLLSLNDGTPLLLAAPFASAAPAVALPDAVPQIPQAAARNADRGLVVFLTAAPDLDWTDLPAKPLMVPLVQEIIREGIGQAHGSWWSIAGSRPTTPGRTSELHPVELQGAGRPAIDDESATAVIGVDDVGATSTPIRRSGIWRALDDRGAARGVVVVNPDTRGGRTQAQDTAGLEQWLARAAPDAKVLWIGDAPGSPGAPRAPAEAGTAAPSLASLLARESPGSPISLPLLIAALAVAIFELLLARWASHASITRPARRKGVAA